MLFHPSLCLSIFACQFAYCEALLKQLRTVAQLWFWSSKPEIL